MCDFTLKESMKVQGKAMTDSSN